MTLEAWLGVLVGFWIGLLHGLNERGFVVSGAFFVLATLATLGWLLALGIKAAL